MKITTATPTQVRNRRLNRPRFNWAPILTALRAAEPTAWVAVQLADLPNDTPVRNQSALIQIAARHVGRVQTQTENGTLFVRVIEQNQTETKN